MISPSASSLCLLSILLAFCSLVSSLSIYTDPDIRGGKQLKNVKMPRPFYDDDYSLSPYREESPKWETAESWPQELAPGGQRYDSYSMESEERPYNWYYYNKFINNGRFNHLYNGPHLDNRAGIGASGNRPPKILPRPASSFRNIKKN